jgi:hypothetical protein
MKTKIIHHISKDFTQEVIEVQTLLFGFLIKRTLTTKFL